MDIENDTTNRHMRRSDRKGFIMFVVNKNGTQQGDFPEVITKAKKRISKAVTAL